MRDYYPMLAAADELSQFQGYLDTDGLKLRNEANGRFNRQVKAFVFKMMREEQNADALISTVNQEIDEFVSQNNGVEDSSITLIRESVVARIRKDAKRPAWLRHAIRWAPAAFGLIIVMIYFGIRFASGVDVSAPIDSKIGLQQRAAAAEKAVEYDDWMNSNTRRGGWLKGILLWPIEPSVQEIKGAGEFASLTLDGYELLTEQREICGSLPAHSADQLSAEQVKFVGEMAQQLRRDDLKWQTPPVMTVLQPIREKFPC